MITVVDYGMGNLGSIKNMLKKIGHAVSVSGDSKDIKAATKIILPGVGSFDEGMARLKSSGLLDILNTKALKQKAPVLGICLGMQMLFEGSDEGTAPGLGWLNGRCVRFAPGNGLKVPHMGWNLLTPENGNPLLKGLTDSSRFYFVHSFHARCADPADVAGTAEYGIEFTAAVARGNIMGVQFHPEKSHRFGMAVLDNFARL
ncbi:imidazole glycerol phosphate synthase subunit HisH [Salidesulfovibrio onnuriiensis]|uniref:imidazole glycerol phosphate synthase subunit HisH n=1 Tax=Salidesulfovibrio onnuriiensis TaxID=2583823 RepID=UPI0011C948C2|nr:imidazole glycerol phosphate synthase subunit HisH [Salidesulfovibrio onnuriiensis]